MIGGRRGVSLRWRVTLAFAAATAVVLAALGLFLHGRLAAELDASVASALRQRAADLSALVRGGTEGLGRSSLVEPGDDLAQVLDARGRVVAGAPGFERRPLLRPSEVRAALQSPVVVERRRIGDGDDEVARMQAAPAGGRVAVVGTTLEERDDALRSLDGLLLAGLPAALLLASAAGYLVARGALRPIDRMRRRADAMGSSELTERLPVPRADDELQRLAHTLNDMLARLAEAFARERTFVADASHELRGPLATLKAELELAAHPARSRDELRAGVLSAGEETDRLSRLADDLLVLARSDGGRLDARDEPVAVADLLARVAARVARGDLVVDAEPELTVRGDPLRLEQAVRNLVDNALHHGAEPVVLRAEGSGDDVVVHVIDAGEGPPAELGDAVFERFTRGDPARARGGAGLGLAIVAAIAASHGGEAGLSRTADGRTDAWIRLPRSGARQAPSAIN
jgi:signal transduction histidine kinase